MNFDNKIQTFERSDNYVTVFLDIQKKKSLTHQFIYKPIYNNTADHIFKENIMKSLILAAVTLCNY